MDSDTVEPSWPLFRSLSGWRLADLGPDLAAGLTLAAIAIPEQIATARLGGFPPIVGFIVFISGTLGFALLGSSRTVSVGADSTIAPILAGSFALIAAAGTPAYAGLGAVLALMIGGILISGGLLRMGWVADLLSTPVTTGFLAGIAVHIVLSQLPVLLGIVVHSTEPLARLPEIISHIAGVNPYSVAIGLTVFAVTFLASKISARIPGALIALLAASLIVETFGLGRFGVRVLGTLTPTALSLGLPAVTFAECVRLLPLALIVSAVVMVQTAATARAFADSDLSLDLARDFIGAGTANILSGLAGGFPANASPPRTAAATESGARSQISGIVAAAAVLALLLFGTQLLAFIPTAALAGILFYVAQHLIRLSTLRLVGRQTTGEFLLIVATLAAIVALPIQTGVGLGILLSLLHGVWTITRTRLIEFERIPGTTIWWPEARTQRGEKLKGVKVIAFQAPLAFLNADTFERDAMAALAAETGLYLIVIEASAIAEIDFTAAQSLLKILRYCRERKIDVAVARLESIRAQAAFVRFGITELLGADRQFHSVQDAIDALGERS